MTAIPEVPWDVIREAPGIEVWARQLQDWVNENLPTIPEPFSLAQNIQDALQGNEGQPSASNRYVTEEGLEDATIEIVNTSVVTTLFANPTAQVGLTAVNGTALTAMRSDAAPALSQAISPTWTGVHTFQSSSGVTLAPHGGGAGNTTELRFTELVGGMYVGFKAPDSVGSNLVFTLPSTSGSGGVFSLTTATTILDSTQFAGPWVFGGNVGTTTQFTIRGTFTATGGTGNTLGMNLVSTLPVPIGGSGFGMLFQPAFVEAASGTHPSIVGLFVLPTITAGAANVTDVYCAQIASVTCRATTTTGIGLKCSATTGAVSNYAAQFIGEVVIDFPGALLFSGSGTITPDLYIYRNSANFGEQRNAANPQSYAWNNTWTSSTNFERLRIQWSGNIANFWTEKGSAGGTARALRLGTDAIAYWEISTSGHLLAVTNNGPDIGGASNRVRTIYVGTNIGLGTTSFGASMVGGMSIGNQTAPTGNVADAFQYYAADQAAGNSCPHWRTENGSVVKLYQVATYTPTNVTVDRSYDADATSTAELADVLGTLIADLKLTGILA